MANRTLQKQTTSGEKSLNNKTGNGEVQPIPEVYALDIQSREFIPSKPNGPSNKRKGIRSPSRHRQLGQRILDIAMLPSTLYSPDTIHSTQKVHQCRGQGKGGVHETLSLRGIRMREYCQLQKQRHQPKTAPAQAVQSTEPSAETISPRATLCPVNKLSPRGFIGEDVGGERGREGAPLWRCVDGWDFHASNFLVRVRRLGMKFIGALSPHHLGVWVRGRNFTDGQGATYKGHRAARIGDLEKRV